MDNNNNFEDLITAIKESSKPTEELAKLLQDRLKPVMQSKLREPDVSRINFGDTSYEVSFSDDYSIGENIVLEYRIRNEITTDKSCVPFVKGMIYHDNDNDTDYILTKAIECGDMIFVTFTASADKVLI